MKNSTGNKWLFSALAALLILVACDDARIGPEHGGGGGGKVDVIEHPTLCDISEKVFEPSCVGCHPSDASAPALSLEGAANSLVNVESTNNPGSTYVVPGDPAGSFLYQKMAGTQGDGKGSGMPLGGIASDEELALLENWINDGAPTSCDAPAPATDGGDTAALACAVQEMFDSHCISCHVQGGTGGRPFLDAANSADIRGGPSPNFDGKIWVVPYYPDASLLYRKVAGPLGNGEGGEMPPSGGPTPTDEANLRAWIEAGANFNCANNDGGN